MESSRHHTLIDFGSKRAIADVIWQALGDVGVFIDPFMGSNAVLLARPSLPKVETCNDACGFVVNAWRAMQTDPDATAHHADQPVHELTLHAMHRWLMAQDTDLVEKLRADPDYYDAKIAGRWLAGICMWIGHGWCVSKHERRLKVPLISGKNVGQGIYQGTYQQCPMVGGNTPDKGIHRKRPMVAADRQGNGVHQGWQQLPHVTGDRAGQGIHAQSKARPAVQGDHPSSSGGIFQSTNLQDWFAALSTRLRRVRICCGDWRRVLTPVVLEGAGYSGIYLDPPYLHSERDSRLYSHDEDIAPDVAAWAREHGDNPRYRIVLSGYEGNYEMPATWTCIAWATNGGYANQRKSGKNGNKYRECLWLSPACETVTQQLPLFADGRDA